MPELRFVDDLPVDLDHTLHQLLSRFRSVRHGLPELVKNAKDQYSAVGIEQPGERVILVLVHTRQKRLAVLDFAGATKVDFDRWMMWSRRADDRRGLAQDIEAGHGNGGKAFMVFGSTSMSFFESVQDGRRTKMGFRNDDPDRRFFPAYFIEDSEEIDDLPVDDARSYLEGVLAGFDMTMENLPPSARAAFTAREAFSIVQLNKVEDWTRRSRSSVRRLATELPGELVNHPQAALAIESCEVWYAVDGSLSSEEPLTRKYPEPLEGFEDIAPIVVPQQLLDPQTQELVDTGSDGMSSFLKLRTSRSSLRMQETKPLNVIRIRNERNVVGSWSLADLHSRAESGYILGELRVPALVEGHLSGAEWEGLADTALVRALENWTAEEVEALAQEIQGHHSRDHKEKEVETANRGLQELRNLMRDFLEPMGRSGTTGGGEGSLGDDDEGDAPPPPPTPPEYGSRVDLLVLEGRATSISMAQGTIVPIIVRAFEEAGDGRRLRVRSPALEFHSEPTNGLSFDEDSLLSGEAGGEYRIWFSCPATGVESDSIAVEVVECFAAELHDVPERILLQGERVTLRPVFLTGQGERSDLLVSATVDEADMGRVNRHCVFTAGSTEGEATVRLRFGAERTDTTTATIQIGDRRISRDGRGGQEGGEIPLILLCGTEVPGKEDYPPDQRTMTGGDHLPTLIDFDPLFEDVIFINPDSRESLQIRQGRGGRRGPMGIGNKTYIQFLALKCFEILKRLFVRQAVESQQITEVQFRQHFAHAETECAPFIEQAYEIARQLTNGDE